MLEVLLAEDVVLAVDAAVIYEEVKSNTPDPDDGEIGHYPQIFVREVAFDVSRPIAA